jgi:hypothetical protein
MTVYLGHTEPRSAWNCSEYLLGISHTQTDLESRSAALLRARQALASDQEESPEGRQRGYRQVDTGSRWLPKEMVLQPAFFLARVRWRWDD